MKKRTPLPRPGRGQLRAFHPAHPIGDMITAAAVQRNHAFLTACRYRRKQLADIASNSRQWLLIVLNGMALRYNLYRA